MENQKRLESYSKNHNIPYLNLAQEYEFDPEVLKLIPLSYAKENKTIALDRFGKILTISMAKPDLNIIKEVETLTGLIVKIFWSKEEHILNILDSEKTIVVV